MPSIYYKDSNNDWVLFDLGSVQKGVFTATTSKYSYNFEEAYTGYVPIVVANALGSQEVKVISVSPTGFIIQVEENAVPCDIMFFAARGEAIPTFEEANGKELLDYYLEQSKTSSDAAQRIASYFNSSFGTMSWADISKMSEVAAHFPYAFSGYVNKTRTVNMGSYGGSTVFRVARVNPATNSSGKGTFTFIADKCIAKHMMNNSNSTQGGWEKSTMRSWLSGTVLPAMPADLQAVIVEVRKVNTSGYGTSSTQDKLWIPSYTEVGLGGNEGSAYGIFTDNSSRIRKYNNSADYWWLRSVNSFLSYYHRVSFDGSLSYLAASNEQGVVPGFCV